MKFAWLFVLLLIIPISSAATLGPFKQATEVDIKVPLLNANLTHLDSSTTTQLTIFKPDNTILIQNESMTWNENFFNKTLLAGQTVDIGEYSGSIEFSSGNDAGFVSFSYLVTPSGTDDDSIAQIILLSFGFLFSIGLITFGISKEDPNLVMFGGIVLFLFGLWTLLNGVGNYRNDLTEWTSIAILGIAGYVSVRTGVEMMNV
jgi:hypothetical protein